MRQDFVVIDNFLDEPDKVRQSVLDIGDQLDGMKDIILV